MVNRSEKLQLFNDSIVKVRDYFIDKASKEGTADYFMHYFGIESRPDCGEGEETTYFEIYWKDRIIDMDCEGADHNEVGAKLALRCSAGGHVTVIVNPCHTENYKCKEVSVILFHRLNPKKLQHKPFLFFLWWTFISYSSVTAVEVSPSVFSRVHVALIRYFCSKRIDGALEGKRVWHDLKFLIGVMFAIITSDLFVYYLPNRKDDEKLIKLEERVTSQEKKIDSLLLLIDLQMDAGRQVDSLQYYLKLIERNTQPSVKKTHNKKQ